MREATDGHGTRVHSGACKSGCAQEGDRTRASTVVLIATVPGHDTDAPEAPGGSPTGPHQIRCSRSGPQATDGRWGRGAAGHPRRWVIIGVGIGGVGGGRGGVDDGVRGGGEVADGGVGDGDGSRGCGGGGAGGTFRAGRWSWRE